MLAKLDYVLFVCLMFLSLIYPGGLSFLKIIIFAVYVLIRFLHLFFVSRKCPIVEGVIIPSMFALLGVAYCLYGLLQDAPGANKVWTVYIAYPIILGFLAATVSGNEAEKIFDVLYILCLVVTFLVTAGMILTFYGFDLSFLYKDSVASVGFIPGFTKFSFQVIDSFTFILPFTLSYIIMTIERRHLIVNAIIISMLFFVAIVSGRKALWVMLLIPLIIVPLFGRVSIYKSIAVALTSVGAIIFTLYLADLDILKLSSELSAGFDFQSSSDDVGGAARGEQFDALARGWLDKPLFGHGLGATAASYGSVRSEETYQYELSYNYHLFALGVFGFSIYASGFLYILYKLYIISKHDKNGYRAFSLFIGMLGFLFGIASNPWLSKFDFMYVVFLPYAYILGKRHD